MTTDLTSRTQSIIRRFTVVKVNSFSDFFTGRTSFMSFSIEGISESVFIVNDHVLTRRNYLQIFNTIIISYFVFVMDKLMFLEFSTKMFFHNKTMEFVTFLTKLNSNVSIHVGIDTPSSVRCFLNSIHVPMPLPPPIVLPTPSSFLNRIITICNRTFHGTIVSQLTT